MRLCNALLLLAALLILRQLLPPVVDVFKAPWLMLDTQLAKAAQVAKGAK